MFKDKLARIVDANKSLLCVGLDPHIVPPSRVSEFNRVIIEATHDLVCAYKPNFAIYDGMGPEGEAALQETLEFIVPSGIPTIADYKRADIANCGEAYAQRVFGRFGFDAVTVYHYMGQDAVEPFQQPQWSDRGIFVLCRTSNRRSGQVQHMPTVSPSGELVPQYLEVARMVVNEWDQMGNIGLVMGATFPEELALVRERHPKTLLLIPGVGTQGGSLENSVKAAADAAGRGFLISVSRSIIYAHTEDKGQLATQDYGNVAKAARQAAVSYRDQINEALERALVAT